MGLEGDMNSLLTTSSLSLRRLEGGVNATYLAKPSLRAAKVNTTYGSRARCVPETNGQLFAHRQVTFQTIFASDIKGTV